MRKKSLLRRICELDDGQYCKVARALPVQNICEDCKVFNPNGQNAYYCGVQGSCIGVTLNADLNAYLLQELGLVPTLPTENP